ncbi:hypothetical protein FNF31_00974 [Cafeteria roenbergensis]|uniref:Sulfotransferase domain-containing protein n=1 Tax=Cafeteria roenbergensis TaxID=33653 RepID=A0A5A8DP99_CAFRO|nr:hypothetical protein FNF31_00974 [Cafeteria roenbergensis]
MAAGKETHFFDHKSPKASLSGYLALLPRLETDAQAFADSNNHDWPKADTSRAITAEATPAYLPWRSAVDGLLTVSPRAKLVAVVREPAQRFYRLLSGGASDHICVSSPGWGKALDALGARPFASDRARAAIAKAEAAGGNASLALLWGAREDCWPLGTGMNIAVDEVARSLFAEQLLIAASAAGPENVLLLEQSALRNDESKALQRVLKLVGLGWSQSPASPSQPSFEEAWADQATVLAGNETATNRGGGSDTAQIVSKVFARFHNNGWAAKGSYPPMPQDLEGRLRHFFAPFNRGLDQIAGVVRG